MPARHARSEELDRRNVWASVQVLGPRYVRLALLLLPAIGVVAAMMTFVTPTRALSTPRARSAAVIGWRLLRSSWSEIHAHVLVPAVTLAGRDAQPFRIRRTRRVGRTL